MQNILVLEHFLWFEVWNKCYILDLFEAYRELIRLQAESEFDEETEFVVSKELISQKLSKVFSYFEQPIPISGLIIVWSQ